MTIITEFEHFYFVIAQKDGFHLPKEALTDDFEDNCLNNSISLKTNEF